MSAICTCDWPSDDPCPRHADDVAGRTHCANCGDEVEVGKPHQVGECWPS